MRRGRCSLAGSVLFSHYEPNRSPNLVPQGHHTTYCGNPKTGQNSLRSKYISRSRFCETLRLPGMLFDSGNSYRVIGSSFHASVIYISLTEWCRSNQNRQFSVRNEVRKLAVLSLLEPILSSMISHLHISSDWLLPSSTLEVS